MDARTQKLAIKLRDEKLAEMLVAAGLDNPAKLRAASDQELRAIDGVGPATVKALRARLGRRSGE